jgi:hypothetical protein
MYQLPDTFLTYYPIPSSAEAFVEYWCQQYDYGDLAHYEEEIAATSITPEQLRRLFAWKNGMPLSQKKAQALEEKIITKLPIIQRLNNSFEESLFHEHFGELRVVWQVFLLHIISPARFPNFDQHVYRAYRCLNDLAEVGREQEPKVTMPAYKEYQAFYLQLLKAYDGPSKRVDDALWAFGKFLSRYPRMVLHRIAE